MKSIKIQFCYPISARFPFFFLRDFFSRKKNRYVEDVWPKVLFPFRKGPSKKFLWATPLWVGRRKEPILSYVTKKESGHKWVKFGMELWLQHKVLIARTGPIPPPYQSQSLQSSLSITISSILPINHNLSCPSQQIYIYIYSALIFCLLTFFPHSCHNFPP